MLMEKENCQFTILYPVKIALKISIRALKEIMKFFSLDGSDNTQWKIGYTAQVMWSSFAPCPDVQFL